MIESLTFLDFLTATLIVELIMITVFRKTTPWGSGDKWSSINRWYTNLGWTAVILDTLSVLIGFYIARYIYNYLLSQNYITKSKPLLKYLAIVLLVQITHDILFYKLIIQPSQKGESIVMDEFIDYADTVKVNAIIGDSIMYLMGVPLLFYVSQQSKVTNEFISIVCLYLIGYLIHQKPV